MSGVRRKGITIVVSPLIALIAEQENKIREHGYEVLAFHGSINQDKQVRLLKDFANRTMTPDFIFVSPEKIATDGLFEYCIKQRKKDISLLVIDEVHCVSQWGLSFSMHTAIVKNFKKYHLFGFTGTPIFAVNAGAVRNPQFFTTEQTFGDQLHTYTIEHQRRRLHYKAKRSYA